MRAANNVDFETIGNCDGATAIIRPFNSTLDWALEDSQGNRIASGTANTVPNAKNDIRLQFNKKTGLKKRWTWSINRFIKNTQTDLDCNIYDLQKLQANNEHLKNILYEQLNEITDLRNENRLLRERLENLKPEYYLNTKGLELLKIANDIISILNPNK
ncbi:hypothetical protein [Paenibacillus agricola]|uniref:Uncharacterized protein n=1 Tax=Paenibacillus agricola TaxID=2716264 RepID=A0ABX0JBP8_9BACL|nr:hypothetical protein [Paenibacillus agricola]NHN33201.1 hypothetical protein [Paenibacillus agricola]